MSATQVLMRGNLRFLLAGISTIAFCWLIPASFSTLGPRAAAWEAQPTVEELIRDLGSDEFEVRERATKLLKDREDEARGPLEKALGCSDPEIARRAKDLLEFYDTRFLLHRVKRIVQFGKGGQVDLMVDGITSLGQESFRHDEVWQTVTSLTTEILNAEKKARGKEYSVIFTAKKDEVQFGPSFPYGDFQAYRKNATPKTIHNPKLKISQNEPANYIMTGERAEFEAAVDSIIVTSESVRNYVPVDFRHCVCFCNGPVEMGCAMQSLIVSDDEIRCSDFGGHCVVISRRDVRVDQILDNSLIIAGNKVFDKRNNSRGNTIRQSDKEFLGVVRFFDPADLGISVRVDKEKVTVAELTDNELFALAGVKKGDWIKALDKEAVTSYDTWRRTLRRKMAIGAPTKLTLVRSEKEIEVKLRWKD